MRRIGEGRTADIFELSGDLVLKLYFSRFDRPWVEHAAEIAGAIAAAGVRTPAVHDVITNGGRHGIVMDRIEGGTMFDELLAHPGNAESMADALAALHVAVHERSIEGLRDHAAHLRATIRRAPHLDERHRSSALEHLDELDPAHAIHHGDFHPANVMIEPDGDAVVIDWDGAKQGAPAADVARSLFLLKDWALAPGPFDPDLIEPMREPFTEVYLAGYLQRSQITRRDIEAWKLPVAAARLAEPIPEERELVLSQVAALVEARSGAQADS